MRSEIIENKSTSTKYPTLMIDPLEDIIVLMSSERIGTIVYSNNDAFSIGEYDDDWNMDDFKLFNGVIELSNNE